MPGIALALCGTIEQKKVGRSAPPCLSIISQALKVIVLGLNHTQSIMLLPLPLVTSVLSFEGFAYTYPASVNASYGRELREFIMYVFFV